MYKTLSGSTRDADELKAIGEIVVIDGNNHEIVEFNSYFSEEREVYDFNYTIKFVEQEVVIEEEISIEEIERLQNL